MPEFGKGNKFGKGRKPGSRNLSTRLLDEMATEGIGEVIAKVKEEAKGGEMRAASILLARAWPRRRGRPVELDLPPVGNVQGVVKAQAELVAALARGEVTPEEAASVSALLENQRRALETEDLDRRITALEDARRKRKHSGRDDAADEGEPALEGGSAV